MNKRVYIGIINESWINNNIINFDSIFNIGFNKDKILNNLIEISKIKKENNNIIDYEIFISLYEIAPVRYKFNYEYGLVHYFDFIINHNSGYGKVLSLLHYNYFKYNIDGLLLESSPEIINPVHGNNHFNYGDASLLEENFNDGKFISCLNYSNYTRYNNEDTKFQLFKDVYFTVININRKPYDKTDSGFDKIYSIYSINTLGEVKEGIIDDVLSNVYTSYMNNYSEDNVSNDDLINTLNDKFIDYSITIYKIFDNKYEIIYFTKDINKLMEETKYGNN